MKTPKPSKEERYAILERDDFCCVICGIGGRFSDIILEVHHILPRSCGGGNEPTNLETLCKRCHMIEHWGFCPPNVVLTFSELKAKKGEK